jgi:hypothetical protein
LTCSLDAPSDLSATAIGQTRIDLAWTDNSNDESGFKVERSPAGQNTWTLITTTGPDATSYSDMALTCGTSYDYRVTATHAGVDSAASDTATATTLMCSLDAPSDLSTAPVSQTQINLGWTDNSNDESGFKVKRSPAGQNAWKLINATGPDATSYADMALTCGTAYDYQVTATHTGGDSAASDTATATTNACTMTLPPQVKSPRNGAVVYTRTPKISWRALKGALTYHILIDDVIHAVNVVNTDWPKASYVPSLSFGMYAVRVSVQTAGGWSQYSAPITFEITLLKSPRKNAAVATHTPRFMWQAVRYANYWLQVNSLPDFSGTMALNKMGLATPIYKTLLTEPLPQGMYYWRVSPDGGATWTLGWSFTVGP